MANSKLGVDEEDKFVESMFQEAELEGADVIDFAGFEKLLGNQMERFSNTSIDFKGAKSAMGKTKINKKSSKEIKFKSVKRVYSPIQSNIRYCLQYIENSRRQLFVLLLYLGICLGVFAERFYTYQVEKREVGMRQLVGFGLPFARGSAAAMSFSFAVLLIITHVAGHCSNFYHLTAHPLEYLCFLRELAFSSDNPPTFSYWVYMTPVGLTGVAIYLIMWAMYLFATPIARGAIFNAFWTSHKAFVLIYVLTIIHGSGRLLQNPWFPYYITGPAILLALDRIVSISRKKIKLDVIKAELLPSNVTMLKFKRPHDFEYKSGQWIRLAVPDQGKDEFHPFTLTSAPHEDHLSVHVRGIGPWTLNLRKTYEPTKTQGKNFSKVEVDGPFGAGQQDWNKFEVAILIGGGIGVTPYASILKDFSHMMAHGGRRRVICKKVYFLWVTSSHHQFEWLIDILRQVEEIDKDNVVSIHCFITQFFHKFDLRTTMLYICEEQFKSLSKRSIFTGLRGVTHFGRPQFDQIFTSVCASHPDVDRVGVFSCGPVGLTKTVEQACHGLGKHGSVKFSHHYENF
ncbi:unnamed protein product [Owenia fusiformis]|uniref:FAD-binding FR-type domain-containing protein n=1 Tax=Owenia fusiformis TaxID=6347 RepID=A0A8S4PJZ4_OWEFU|nr:unnamed protein product [Owenia fusiformis]